MNAKLTAADVAANIRREFYFTAAQGVQGESEMGTRPAGSARHLERLTFCVLVLQSGFTVTGESFVANEADFNAATGREVAKADALRKVWPLMAYALREHAEFQPE